MKRDLNCDGIRFAGFAMSRFSWDFQTQCLFELDYLWNKVYMRD